MEVRQTDIDGILIIKPRVFTDQRGYFCEVYSQQEFEKKVSGTIFVQENESKSLRGVLRGLHFQKPPYAQAKLVRVVKGEVLDVAVDIRKSSARFGQWVAVELSEDNQRQLWVPPGFAHGFVVFSETAEFLYKTTDYYAPAHERCIIWNDAQLSIDWQLNGLEPQLSAKDQQGKAFAEADVFA